MRSRQEVGYRASSYLEASLRAHNHCSSPKGLNEIKQRGPWDNPPEADNMAPLLLPLLIGLSGALPRRRRRVRKSEMNPTFGVTDDEALSRLDHAFVGIHEVETFGDWDVPRDLGVASTSSGISLRPTSWGCGQILRHPHTHARTKACGS